jgi:hypothetical protein
MKWYRLSAGLIGRALVTGGLLGVLVPVVLMPVVLMLYAGTESTISVAAICLAALLVLLLVLTRIRKKRNERK